MLFGKRFYQSFLQEAFDESITIEITTIDRKNIGRLWSVRRIGEETWMQADVEQKTASVSGEA